MPKFYEFSKIFPSNMSRWFASAAIVVGSAGFAVVHWLSQFFPELSNTSVIFFQVYAFLTLAILCLVLSNCAALLHIGNMPARWPVERYMKLSADKRVLLALSSISEPTTEKIAEQTLMAKDAVDHWINHHRDKGRIAVDPPLRLTPEGHSSALAI